MKDVESRRPAPAPQLAVVTLDGKPIAMSPDLICVLDSVSGEAVGSETIRYGQRVTVVALPAPAILMSIGCSTARFATLPPAKGGQPESK